MAGKYPRKLHVKMSEKDFCFCDSCRGEIFCHRTTIQRHFKRQEAFNSSFESHQDTSFEDTSFQDTETGSDVVEGSFSHATGSEDLDLTNCSSHSDDEVCLDNSIDATREEAASVQSEPPEFDITGFLLRHLKNKIVNGISQEATMAGLRNLYELLKDDRIPHESWKLVIQYLKGLGYQDARIYKICFGKDHVTLMEHKECCVDCGKEWKDGVNYYVLGFFFEDIFLNSEFLLRHLEHWKAREEWFNLDEPNVRQAQRNLAWDLTQ